MMGMGMGVGFSAPPPWTPAALSPTLWLGAYEEARGTRNTAPVPDDWDMEAAGVARWALASAGGVPTKEANAPYVGTQCMKITVTGDGHGVFQANKLTLGNRYQVSAAIQSDGVVRGGVCIGVAGVNVIFSGTSTDWTVFTGDSTAESVAYRPFINSVGAAAGFFRVDDMRIVNLSLRSYLPRIGAALSQATPTAMPWAGALGMMFDGDLLPWGGAADAKCLHTGDGGSLGWQYRPTTLKAENRIVATAATAVGNVGVCVSCTNANTIRVRVMNGGGAYDYDSGDVACNIAINNTYTMVLRVATGAGGVSLRVNGVEVISGALTAPSAANATTGLMFGGDAAGAATNVTGYIGKGLLVPRALTVAECAQFEAYCAGGATL